MNIQVQYKYGAAELLVTADNVKIEEDASERLYGTSEDGKRNFADRLGEDIATDVLEMFSRTTEDLIYYRKRPFDSASLIEQLFDKLPDDKKAELVKRLEVPELD